MNRMIVSDGGTKAAAGPGAAGGGYPLSMNRIPLLAVRVLRVCLVSSLVIITGGRALAQDGVVSPETLPQGFVVLVEDQAKMASAGRPIYFASGANSWNPGDPEYVLSPRSDGRWQFVFQGGTLGENVEFKFTLGSWKFVETDADGQDISNRVFPDVRRDSFTPGERPVIELTIPRFREGSGPHQIDPAYRPLEVTGAVRRVQVAGGAGAADGRMRDLIVWLPPGYDDRADTAFPVLYMMDGQNLFQAHEGVPAEWRLDETATELIGTGACRPFIVVGVPHGGASRLEEYVPTLGEGQTLFGATPDGDDHVAWLAREVMPRVERAFRVKTGPDNTGIGGASAGGLIALHAALERPDLFGLVLAESPALQLDAVGLDMVERVRRAGEVPSRVFVGMGTQEHLPGSGFYDRDTGRHLAAAEALRDALEGRSSVRLVIGDDHGHNEIAWAIRLHESLPFLFPGR